MSRVDTATGPTAADFPVNNVPVGNSIQDLDLDVFLDLMLTELQNQDPLNPMDNQEMLNTISQIREISASDKLSGTLDSVLRGQNVTTATGLIGTKVEGLTDDGRRVNGDVQNVTINDGEPELELAVNTSASAAETEGGVAEGAYTYSVVWEAGDNTFGVQVPVDTSQFAGEFNGSIRLENLPQTDGVPKRVYRTKQPNGEPQFVGPLPGSASRFVDSRSDGELQDESYPAGTSFVSFANSVKVRLNNIRSVETIQR